MIVLFNVLFSNKVLKTIDLRTDPSVRRIQGKRIEFKFEDEDDEDFEDDEAEANFKGSTALDNIICDSCNRLPPTTKVRALVWRTMLWAVMCWAGLPSRTKYRVDRSLEGREREQTRVSMCVRACRV